MGWPFESHPLKFYLRACPISGSDKLCPPGYFVRPFELLTRADLLSIGLFGLFLARTYLLEAYWISEYLNCPCDGPSHNKFWSACNLLGYSICCITVLIWYIKALYTFFFQIHVVLTRGYADQPYRSCFGPLLDVPCSLGGLDSL